MTNAQELSEIQIRERAYNLWERGGRPENESAHFWNKACEQLILENTPDPSIQEMVQGYDYLDIKKSPNGRGILRVPNKPNLR